MTEKAFEYHQLDWRYLTLEVAPDDLGDAVRGMRAMGFCGGNITGPYKQTIVPMLDRTSRAAGLVGVVNVLARDDSGMIGENTEGKALVEGLAERTDLAGSRVVVFGAGRMGRAAAVELALAGAAEITVLNRTPLAAAELAALLAQELHVATTAAPWDDDYSLPPETNIVIHATSLAENDPEARVPLDFESLTSSTIVVDTTIDPPHTWLLREARQRGCATLDGVEILSRQAAINFALWTGTKPDRGVMREAVEEFLEL